MTAHVAPPDLAGEISHGKRRVDAIERKLNDLNPEFKPEVVFSYSGLLAAAGSPPYEFGIAERSYLFVARVIVPGITDTTVDLLKNGVTVTTVTLKAGQYRAARSPSIRWAANSDELRFVITGPGTDAEDLTVMARFKVAS